MTTDDLIHLARSVAGVFNLDPALICAIVEQESDWNPGATRYEPAFKKQYVDQGRYPEPESTNRATSWGLMQIMGETARERGFIGEMEQLLLPEVNLTWGCRYLESRIAAAEGNISTALLLWNGGGNSDYPEQVFARVDKYRDGRDDKAMSA